MDEIRFLGDLQRLDVKPGDTFVLSMEGNLSHDAAMRLKDQMQQALGGANVIILCNGMKIGVLGSEG